MTALALLLAQALLVVSVLGVRPDTASRMRLVLLLQAGLLCLSLLARACIAAPAVPPLCAVLALAEFAILFKRAPRISTAPTARTSLWPIVAAVLVVWLGFRLLPGAAPLAGTALGIVFCGLVGSAAAFDSRSRWAALLMSGHGVLVFVGDVPGSGWPGLFLAVPLHLLALDRLCARPVWTDPVETAAG